MLAFPYCSLFPNFTFFQFPQRYFSSRNKKKKKINVFWLKNKENPHVELYIVLS